MFKKLIVGIALCVSFGAFAAQATMQVDGLSEAQVAELKAIAAAKVAEVAKQADGSIAANLPKDPGALTTMAATWGTQAAAAAEGFAKALGIAAKELGVTVNDFLHTDAGKLTALLIIWKVTGTTIIHTLYAGLFFVFGMCITRMIYTRLFTKGYEKVEYSRLGGFFKGTKMVRIPKGFQDLQKDGEWMAFWVLIAMSIATIMFTGVILS